MSDGIAQLIATLKTITKVTDSIFFFAYLAHNIFILHSINYNLKALGRTAIVTMSLFQVQMLARMVESFLTTES